MAKKDEGSHFTGGVLKNAPEVPAAIVPGDKSKGAKYIAEHPEEYGFSWSFGAIGKGVGAAYVELRKDCPHIDVSPEQVPLFVATFGPAAIRKWLMGVSVKVNCDRVNRDTLDDNMSVTNAALREKIVSGVLLGVVIRSGGVVTRYVVNGVVYSSEEAAKAADAKASENTKEKQTAEAAAFLEMCATMEPPIPADIARTLAAQQYPLAFAK